MCHVALIHYHAAFFQTFINVLALVSTRKVLILGSLNFCHDCHLKQISGIKRYFFAHRAKLIEESIVTQ